MDRAERRNKAKAEKAWQTQIVLCYEHEPYLAFDVTPDLLESAIAYENPPTTSDDAAHGWVIATLNQLREEVALIRDHSDELMLEPGRRDVLACKGILMVQYLLTVKQQSLANVGGVLLDLLARQSLTEANAPGFRIIAFSEPLSVEQIRAMSTARHLYIHEGDTIEQVPPPSQPSKDRSTDRTCISIQAFWRNDKPGGIMINMSANVEQGQTSLDAELDVLDDVVLTLAETRPSAKDVEEFLTYMAQQPGVQQPEKDRVASMQTMAAIAFAEEAGYLHSDEYNGMVYIYRVGEDGAFIDRKDRPQRPS